MTKRLMIAWVVVAAFLVAVTAWATIGSIISSFPINPLNARYGIYRESAYVYLSQNDNNRNYLRKLTTTGSFVTSVRLLGGDPYPLYGGSRTHVGGAYVALCDNANGYLKIFSINGGGSPVTSFRVINSPYNNFWNGEFYYVNGRGDRGLFRRYTPSGVYVGTWTCSGWPATMHYCGGAAYAQRGNMTAGPYFVASSGEAFRPCCITTFPAGSLVSTWHGPSPGNVASVFYADSSKPATYGAAIWAVMEGPRYVVEFDIDARNASQVLPASLGKVKAIYR